MIVSQPAYYLLIFGQPLMSANEESESILQVDFCIGYLDINSFWSQSKAEIFQAFSCMSKIYYCHNLPLFLIVILWEWVVFQCDASLHSFTYRTFELIRSRNRIQTSPSSTDTVIHNSISLWRIAFTQSLQFLITSLNSIRWLFPME